MNGMAMPPRTFKQKVFSVLYPWQHCFAPDAPGEFKDCIHHEVTVVLSFADRVRILFSGHLRVSSRIVTEHTTGQTISSAVSFPIVRGQQERTRPVQAPCDGRMDSPSRSCSPETSNGQ